MNQNLSPYKRCILFLVDGARPDVLKEELAKGNLPNISRYLVESGTCTDMLSCFPSTTGPAYLPYITGCHPGTCNVPGIRWFDKNNYAKKGWSLKSFRSYVGLETFLLNSDIKKEIKSIYEIIDNPISILSMVNKGIKGRQNRTRFMRIWYIYYAHLTDRYHFVDQLANKLLIKSLDDNPEFVFCVYPAVDEYSHRSSPFHPRARKAYQEFDICFGEVIQKLKSRGQLDETLMMIVSDHGLSETHTHFDVAPWLEDEKKIKTFYYSQIFKRNFKAAVCVSGNSMAHLYFSRNENYWEDRAPIEDLNKMGLLIDELRFNPAISVVATQATDRSIHLHTAKGHGAFKKTENGIEYSWNHDEPLGIWNEFRATKKLSWDESIVATYDSHYPDIFNQFYQLFKSPRSGDIIISANSGFDLRDRFENPEHKASHGAICPEHMKIPLVSNFKIPHIGRPIRSVDIFPTVLKLLGKEIPQNIDGVTLV